MKKIIPVMLSLTMFVSMNSVAFAASSTSGDLAKDSKVHVEVETKALTTQGSARGALPARQQDVVSSLTSAKKNLLTTSSFRAQSANPTWIQLSNYQVFNQITDYNCGPASVQAALNYLNGYTPNQSDIAHGCKTTTGGSYLADLKNYINSQQSKNTYEAMYRQNFQTMKNSLYAGIVSYDAPPIIGMAFSSNDGWLYSSGGHFMSVFGTMSDKSGFILGDPWIGYSNSGFNGYSWSYSKSASDIYNAYHNGDIGFMY